MGRRQGAPKRRLGHVYVVVSFAQGDNSRRSRAVIERSAFGGGSGLVEDGEDGERIHTYT